jgi:hypothetical protein
VKILNVNRNAENYWKTVNTLVIGSATYVCRITSMKNVPRNVEINCYAIILALMHVWERVNSARLVSKIVRWSALTQNALNNVVRSVLLVSSLVITFANIINARNCVMNLVTDLLVINLAKRNLSVVMIVLDYVETSVPLYVECATLIMRLSLFSLVLKMSLTRDSCICLTVDM